MQPTTTPKGKTIQTPTSQLPGGLGELLGYDEKGEYVKQLTSLYKEKSDFTSMLKNKEITPTQYDIYIEDVKEQIDYIQKKVDNL